MFCVVLLCWHSPFEIVVYSPSTIYRRGLYAGRRGRSNTAQGRRSIQRRRRVAFHFCGPRTHGESGDEVRDLLLEHPALLAKIGRLYPPLRLPSPYQSSTVISIVYGCRYAVLTFSGSGSGRTSENPVSKALGKIPRSVFARCAAIVSTIGIQYRNRYQTQGTHVTLPPSRWPIGDTALISYPRREKVRKPDLQLGHQRLQCVQEFASAVMRRWLLVKLPFKGTKELVELFRFDHGPRDDL